MHYDVEFDATELACPLPLLHTKKKLATLEKGKILKVLTKDKSSVIDFKAYASVSGHELLNYEEHSGIFCFYLKK